MTTGTMDDQSIVLLVEDNLDDADLIRHAFRKADVRNPLVVFDDGDKAIDYLLGREEYADRQRFPVPRLILLDLKLPRRSGNEVLSVIRATDAVRQIPVVVLTSSNREDDIRKAYDAGANAYLVKPMGGNALVTMIRSIHAFWISQNSAPY
ncbi:response regulator [Marivita sp.]|uniref:response regulator n=1 Tax=Marivita sp. TaxID=2003365 RepID=UPI0025BBCE42|nr:response regulator [Marivita sp.]